MKNKSTTDLRLVNILLIFGATAAVLLISPSQMQLVFSSNQSQDPSKGSEVPSTTLVPPVFKQQEAVNHINQAQSALQEGDTAVGLQSLIAKSR